MTAVFYAFVGAVILGMSLMLAPMMPRFFFCTGMVGAVMLYQKGKDILTYFKGERALRELLLQSTNKVAA